MSRVKPIETNKKTPADDFIRVGVDYFKVIEKPDRFGIVRKELKRWNKDEIKMDHGNKVLMDIKKYDDFIIMPNNNGLSPEHKNCYNMYHPFPHQPNPGNWYWTFVLLKQVFGTQFKSGMIYLQVMYLFPEKILPILVLVSKRRETGKSTFLDWLNMLFGANMAMIDPDTLGSQFNSEYATCNVIAIDETIVDRQIVVEKVKSLATKKFINVNIKQVQQFKVPFFGKIIMASNNEDKFIRIEDEEIRFWVRKLPEPRITNHNILNDCIAEIPAFLHYLTTMPIPDFSKSRQVLTPEMIKNEYLEEVVKESKSNLYKELVECFTEYFNNNPTNTLTVTPSDIKNKWFRTENKIDRNYIRRVLKLEFNKESSNTAIRYTPFNEVTTRVGNPFTFTRGEFGAGYVEEEEQPF